MPILKVDKFLGYNTKPDEIINASIASIAENVIINKGDICNIPYPNKVYTSSAWTRVLASTYKEFIIFYNEDGEYFLLGGDFGGSLSLNVNEIFNNFSNFISPFPGPIHANESISGNLVEIGDWILVLQQLGRISTFDEIPYMFRVSRFPIGSELPPTNINLIMPIGLKQPLKIDLEEIGQNGNITGIRDFAITFVTSFDEDTTTTTLGRRDIESNATLMTGGEQNFPIFSAPLFKIFLPKDHMGFIPKFMDLRVGIYSKKDTQGDYFFHTYKLITGERIREENGDSFIRIPLTNSDPDQDLTKTAPTTGLVPELGSHDVPRPARHGAFFKNRMYYASISVPEPTRSVGEQDAITTGFGVKNRLEYSQTPTIGDVDFGRHRYINYIEGQQFIGKDTENITGLIEFNGQLIIFKETETIVLTNDVLIGTFRVLFHDLGGININGGKAYIVIKNILYWGSIDSIYSYDGINKPVRISEPIQEDLNKIDSERYSFMRLGSDPRYNLLYINFPTGHKGSIGTQKSFIYNHEEKVWTTMSQVEQLFDVFYNHRVPLDSKPVVYFNKQDRLEQLGFLDDNALVGFNRKWIWKSGRLIFNRQAKIKHWKLLRINSVNEFEDLEKFASTPNGDILPFVFVVDKSSNKELYLGFHSNFVTIKFNQTAEKAFRINGFELEAHVKGRR